MTKKEKERITKINLSAVVTAGIEAGAG